MSTLIADLRYSVRSLLKNPGPDAGRDPVARPRHRRQHDDLHLGAGGAVPAHPGRRRSRRDSHCRRWRTAKARAARGRIPTTTTSAIAPRWWTSSRRTIRPSASPWTTPPSAPGAAWSAATTSTVMGITPGGRPVLHRQGRRRRRAAIRWSCSATPIGSAASPAIPSVVGKQVTINNVPMTIIGVAPGGLHRLVPRRRRRRRGCRWRCRRR